MRELTTREPAYLMAVLPTQISGNENSPDSNAEKTFYILFEPWKFWRKPFFLPFCSTFRREAQQPGS